MNPRDCQRIADYLDGELSFSECETLHGLLSQDIELQTEFVRQSSMHRQLYDSFATEKALAVDSSKSLVDNIALEVPVQHDPSQWPGSVGFLAAAVHLTASWLSSPKVLALTVIGGLATYFVGLMISIAISRAFLSDRQSHEQAESSSSADSPARIVATAGCRWQDRAPQPAADGSLPPGTAQLAEGVIRLQFVGGAQVTIQAPAEFAPRSPQRIELVRGRLVAIVPPQARGFTVDTPSAQLVDLGTEFAVAVDDQGSTEVQVHRGRVEVKSAGTARSAARQGGKVVVAGEAVRVSAADTSPTPIQFNPAQSETILSAIAAAPTETAPDTNFAGGAPIWLGNLFDDPPGTRLADAVRSDTFKAVPKPHRSLGVVRTFHAGHSLDSEDGWQYVSFGKAQIAPNVTVDLSNLGWIGALSGAIANDAFTRWAEPPDGPPYSSGGISTRGTLPVAPDSPKIEEGIGMMPDALLTFDLDEIRAAGDLAGRKLVFYCPRAGIADNSAMGQPHLASVYFAVFVTGGSGEILAAVVNGKPVRMVRSDDVWSVAQVPGKPQGGYDEPILFVVPIAPEARYLSLVTTLADTQSGGDFAVWSGACLKVVR